MKPLKSDEIYGNWANMGTKLRWPYRSVPEEKITALKNKAQELIPEFF